jgi:geranylgeranyl pyrophosphate synthase
VAATSAGPAGAPNGAANGTVGSTNNGVNSTALLFEPVRAGLQRVEERLRAVDGSVFAPLAIAFIGLIGRGGKRLRPALALMAAHLGDAPPDEHAYSRVVALAASVEMLHTSTLVHDDVIDMALLRRGAPTLNAMWSGGSTVLAGNYMFGTAAQLSAETGNMRVIRTFSETLKTIVDGELQQLLARYRYDQPKEEYYQRIYAKTASLFCAATEGAAVLAGMGEGNIQKLRNFGYHFGMAFQIMDDILDFTGSAETLGKPAGSDLQQGTLTLPFFHYLHSHPEPERLIATLEAAHAQAEDGDAAAWQQAVARTVRDLRAGPAVGEALGEARSFLRQAHECLRDVPDNEHRAAMLGLADFVVQRTY